MKCSAVQNSTVLHCTVLYCTALHCAVLYCTVLYSTVLYCTVQYSTVLYCTVLNCTVLYCTALECAVLYCTVLYFIVLIYFDFPHIFFLVIFSKGRSASMKKQNIFCIVPVVTIDTRNDISCVSWSYSSPDEVCGVV